MDKLKVRILSPRKTVFEGEALAVSSTNSAGKFDVLPLHANFVTLVDNAPITIRAANLQTLNFKFPLAVISVNKNRVDIFTDIEFKTTPD